MRPDNKNIRVPGLDDNGADDHDELEQRILDEALEMFLAQGYHGTTNVAVAARVGIPPDQLREHFSNKEALFCMVVDREWTRARAAYKDGIPHFDKSIDAARFLMKNHRRGLRDSHMYRLQATAVYERERAPNLLAFFRTPDGEGLVQAIATHVLNEIAEQGLFEFQDTEIAARQYLGMLHQALIGENLIIGREIADLDDYLEACAQAFCQLYAR